MSYQWKRPVLILGLLALAAWIWLSADPRHWPGAEGSQISVIPSNLDLLQNDRLEDKQAAFDPTLVDSRPYADWEINASGAVVELDIQSSSEMPLEMGTLHSSYAAAAQNLEKINPHEILPSINSLDGKAKQFDDGLMAAIVSATAAQRNWRAQPAGKVLDRLSTQLANGSDAQAWVFAALEIGGYLDANREAPTPAKTAAFVSEFLAGSAAKPLGFYAWTPDLKRVWRFYSFLRQELKPTIGVSLRTAIVRNQQLKNDYTELIDFFARLSNPPATGFPSLLQIDRGFFLPPMATREDELFNKLFGNTGIAKEVDLMQEFVKAIRSGAVELTPRKSSGWYDYQMHALETFLLAERGRENQKLLLTKAYKQRMLEAFKTLATKRRESHVEAPPASAAPQPSPAPVVVPRLRVEPNPTFYLRTARSYAFIEQVLQTFLRTEGRQGLSGLREDGPRELPLKEELARMKALFYGLHLIACEDIGMAPDLMADELPDPAAAKAIATQYLAGWMRDRDLAADTRVCVPVAGARLWCTIGVKAITLVASYARAPRGRPAGSQAEWTELKTRYSRYLLLADEFAEVPASLPISRKELREVANREKTRDRIVAALAK
ncbi:MAG: hypothetical protein NDI67_00980 [Sulfuritalea sp.]|nr:hypothetical protein [Sulfuritalea sp.]